MPETTSKLTSWPDCLIHGEVEIAPGVAIAAGTILEALPGSRLIISADVCLGADLVIQAKGGDLLIEPGASVGSGTLIVGHGRIGSQACVGSGSTLINPHVQPHQVVPPKSLVGDSSRSLEIIAEGSDLNGHTPSPVEPVTEPIEPTAASSADESDLPPDSESSDPTPAASAPEAAQPSNGLNPNHVYGKAQVNRLLDTLFPHRQALNSSADPNNTA